MKHSLQQEIDQAERAVMQRDERLLDRLTRASQLAGQAAERGRWVIRGGAVGLGSLLLLSLLRGRRGAPRTPAWVAAPHTAQSALWAATPFLLPLLLPGREAATQSPMWLRAARLAASLLGRLQAQRRRRPSG